MCGPIFLSFFIFQKTFAENKKNLQGSKSEFLSPPALKADEYAIFLDESYQVFKTKKFQGLELSEDCVKNNKPKCLAFEFAQIKPKNLTVKYEGYNNFAAIHCASVNGKNLIALDSKNNQYNFCQFSDKSLVNSWSMYYKSFPNKPIK